MKASLLLVILSTLSQIYTLPTLRDDLTVLEYHPYQIQRLKNRENSSDLSKRAGAIATLYWDADGAIKAIFNMDINYEAAQAFENSGVHLAHSVLSECERYVLHAAWVYLFRAVWTVQLGRHWRNILQSPGGITTVAILVVLRPEHITPADVARVLAVLQQWFTQGGNEVNVVQVQNARDAGNPPGNHLVDGGSITEERTFENPSKSRFCHSPIQNSPFVFTVGKLDSLLTTPIKC